MSTNTIDRRALLGLLLGSSAATWTVGLATPLQADELSTGSEGIPADGNVQLQAIGALGVGHIQSTLGLIGVIADSVSKEMYTPKQVEDLMNGTVNGLESPKRLLRRLQDSNVSGDDAEFLDRMISVLNALQREARALTVFAKSRKPEDASLFEKSRRIALKKLGELTQQEEFLHTDSDAPRVPTPKSVKGSDAIN